MSFRLFSIYFDFILIQWLHYCSRMKLWINAIFVIHFHFHTHTHKWKAKTKNNGTYTFREWTYTCNGTVLSGDFSGRSFASTVSSMFQGSALFRYILIYSHKFYFTNTNNTNYKQLQRLNNVLNKLYFKMASMRRRCGPCRNRKNRANQRGYTLHGKRRWSTKVETKRVHEWGTWRSEARHRLRGNNVTKRRTPSNNNTNDNKIALN